MGRLILLIILFILNLYAQNDILNHRKYWYFKSRLINDFMKVGINPGDNMIANQRGIGVSSGTFNDPQSYYIKFGDQTSVMGYYFAVLATEFKLLQLNQITNLDSVIYQIYCALYSFNRLDIVAEQIQKNNISCGGGKLNGFFVRDDVYKNYIKDNYDHFNYYSYGINNNNNSRGFLSKFQMGVKDIESSSWYDGYEKNGQLNTSNDPKNYEGMFASQDQIYSLIYGLAHIVKFIPNSTYAKDKNGNPLYFQDGLYSLRDEARAIIKRLINQLRDPLQCNGNTCNQNWHITLPHDCTKFSADVGADLGAGTFTYPLAESACLIDHLLFGNDGEGIFTCGAPSRCKSNFSSCNAQYHNFTSLNFPGYFLWNSTFGNMQKGIGQLPANKFHNTRTMGACLLSVCNCLYNQVGPYFYNNSKQKIDQIADVGLSYSWYMYNFVYSYLLLHNKLVKNVINNQGYDIIYFINNMNPCGHWDIGQNNYSNIEWSTDSRIDHLERLGNLSNVDQFYGEYNSVDFLLYHNLWYLYHKIYNTPGINTYFTDLGDIYIKNNYYTNSNENAFETIVVENTNYNLYTHGYLSAGKEITLKPQTHIKTHSVNVSSPNDPVYQSLNSGIRLYIRKYNCAYDLGSYDPNIDPSNFKMSDYFNTLYVDGNYCDTMPYYNVKSDSKNNYINEDSINLFQNINQNKYLFMDLNNVELFPNPANEYFNIHFNDMFKINYTYLKILDSNGFVVYETDIKYTQQKIDVSNIKSGCYIVEIYSNESYKICKKLILLH